MGFCASEESRLMRVAILHREIAAGNYPKLKDVAAAVGCNIRTAKRDLRFLRVTLGAPLKRRRVSLHKTLEYQTRGSPASWVRVE